MQQRALVRSRNKMERPNHQSHKEHEHAAVIPSHEHHEHHEHSHEHTHDAHEYHEEAHVEHKKTEEKKQEETKEKIETKQEKEEESKKKVIKQVKEKKEEAIARGMNLHASKKHCMYICRFIKNKTVDSAILELEQVIKFKKPIPFKGEIPHRKGKGIMAGRYPVKTAAFIIKLLKGLKGNIIVNGLDPEKARIYLTTSNWASRPVRREGRKAKRANVVLRAKEIGEIK